MWTAVVLALAIVSHGIVAIYLAVAALVIVLMNTDSVRRLRHGATVGVAVVLLSLFYGFGAARKSSPRAGSKVRAAELAAHKDRLLSDAAQLARAHAEGEVGPETYARRRRELAQALARVLKEISEIKEAKAPATAAA